MERIKTIFMAKHGEIDRYIGQSKNHRWDSFSINLDKNLSGSCLPFVAMWSGPLDKAKSQEILGYKFRASEREQADTHYSPADLKHFFTGWVVSEVSEPLETGVDDGLGCSLIRVAACVYVPECDDLLCDRLIKPRHKGKFYEPLMAVKEPAIAG